MGYTAVPTQQHNFLMLDEDERYDFAHFEFIMRQMKEMLADYPAQAPHISLSLHCEIADILNAYTAIVEREGKLKGLPAYHAARPPPLRRAPSSSSPPTWRMKRSA